MIIYKTTNLINGKIYIGQDKNNNSDYYGSGILITKAIKKYGKQHFQKEVIEICSSKEHLNEREIYWIAEFDARNPLIGYNINKGGDGTPLEHHSEDTRVRIGNSLRGIRRSEETKRKISESKKGKLKLTDEAKQHLREINIGKKLDLETRLKISESNKGKPGTMTGRKHSAESIEKMRLAKIGKKHSEETKLKMRKKHK